MTSEVSLLESEWALEQQEILVSGGGSEMPSREVSGPSLPPVTLPPSPSPSAVQENTGGDDYTARPAGDVFSKPFLMTCFHWALSLP